MPFLQPPDTLPEAMRFVVRALLAHDEPVPLDELLRLVGPLGAVEAMDEQPWATSSEPAQRGRLIAERSVAAMAAVELVRTDPRPPRTVALADRVRDRFPSWGDVDAGPFAKWLLNDLFGTAPDAEARWDVGEDLGSAPGARDLALGFAVLLHRPRPLEPLRPFESGAGSLADLQIRWFGPDSSAWVVRNKERYNALRPWATYLGVARDLGRGGLVIDASRALRPHVLDLVDSGEVLIDDLVTALGQRLSFTDRGWAGVSVATGLEPSPPADEVSPGLALALCSLAAEGSISLFPRSDAAAMRFPVSDSRQAAYSHVGRGKDGDP